MNSREHEAKRRQEELTRLLAGRSFEDACRTYVLTMRSPQYLSAQPLEQDGWSNGVHEHYFQNALKRFPGGAPARERCGSREELLAETARLTGLSERESEGLLHRLFAFQPELSYSSYGALCKPESLPVPELRRLAGEVSIPYETVKKELPDEWYISLQIPEKLIGQMLWGLRKTGEPRPLPCSGHFAEQVLRLYKRRRGEFIRRYSFGSLNFLWLEYGSMKFPRREAAEAVGALLAAAGQHFPRRIS